MAKKASSYKGKKEYQARIAQLKKEDLISSESFGERIGEKIPWVGFGMRKPKINFPRLIRRKISIPMPAKTLTIAGIYLLLFLMQMGIVYIIYRDAQGQMLALGATDGGDPLWLYPSIHEQFIIEGIVASILIFLCSSGFLLLYQSSKHLYNRTIALRIMVIGLIMIVVSFIFLQYMVAVKTRTLAATLRELAAQIG